MIIEPKHDFGSVHDLFTETVVTALLKVIPFRTRPVSACTVHLPHSPMGGPADYEAAFGKSNCWTPPPWPRRWPSRLAHSAGA